MNGNLKKIFSLIVAIALACMLFSGCAPAAGSGDAAAGSGVSSIIMIVVLILVFYFFMIRRHGGQDRQYQRQPHHL